MTYSRTALVTGGAGFIGAHLVARLEHDGWQVLVLDDLSEGRAANLRYLNARSEIVIGDVAKADAFQRLPNVPIDVIYHLAAQANVAKSTQDPQRDFDTNVVGTFNVLEFARRRQVPRMIFASTVSVYTPDARLPISEDTPTHASSPYGASKAAAENYCFAYATTYQLNVTVLRLFNVFGPLMSKYVLHDLLRKLQRDPRRLVILGDGQQVRDYLYIDDAVRAFILAAERGLPGEVYNLGSGVPIKISDLACSLIDTLQIQNCAIEYTQQSWPGDIKAWYADRTKFTALGFDITVPWAEGLRRTVQFLIDYPNGLPDV
jgi:UDP-glucose 4-epimerase